MKWVPRPGFLSTADLVTEVRFLLDAGEWPGNVYRRLGYASGAALQRRLCRIAPDLADRIPGTGPVVAGPPTTGEVIRLLLLMASVKARSQAALARMKGIPLGVEPRELTARYANELFARHGMHVEVRLS